jgi:hypothetical protein
MFKSKFLVKRLPRLLHTWEVVGSNFMSGHELFSGSSWFSSVSPVCIPSTLNWSMKLPK